MKDLSGYSVSQLREAAEAWRKADKSKGFFGTLTVNASLHDKIDDMISEIERLRGGSK